MKTILALLLVSLLLLAQGELARHLRKTGGKGNCVNCADCFDDFCITCIEGYVYKSKNTCKPAN